MKRMLEAFAEDKTPPDTSAEEEKMSTWGKNK